MKAPDQTTPPLHLVFATDDAYVPHGATMLVSFFRWHRKVPVVVHLVSDAALSPANRAALRALVETSGATWQEHEVPAQVVDKLPAHPRYPKSAWFRILFADVLPQPRILYLDCDLVVTGSLLPLWRMPLQGKVLAAATDGMWPHSTDYFHRYIFELGLTEARQYFNTGVMVLDLDRLRAEGWPEKLMDFVVHQRGPMPCADQDAMNAMLRDRWLPIGARWNLMPPLLMSWQQGVESLSRREILHAVLLPRVVHFFGDAKPWKDERRHPLRSHYWQYRQHSDWAATPPVPLPVADRLLRWLPSRLHIAIRGSGQIVSLGFGHGVARARFIGGGLLNRLPSPIGRGLRRLLRPLIGGAPVAPPHSRGE